MKTAISFLFGFVLLLVAVAIVAGAAPASIASANSALDSRPTPVQTVLPKVGAPTPSTPSTQECVTSASLVASPSRHGYQEFLAVAAVADNDVWATGQYFSPTTAVLQPLLEHWNGSGWTDYASSFLPTPSEAF